MQADTSAPTPSETRIVIEMTEDEARELLARSPNFIAHLEETIAKALASPAIPAKPTREPDRVRAYKYLHFPAGYDVAWFGEVTARSDSLEIDLCGVWNPEEHDDAVRPVENIRKIAHDMLAACDWAERQAAQRAAAEYQFTGDLLSEPAPIANNQPPDPDARRPVPNHASP